MKLLYISKTSLIAGGGGSEKKADILTKKLSKRGNEVVVVCGKTDKSLKNKINDGGRIVRHIKCVPDLILDRPVIGFYAPRYLFALISLPILIRLIWKCEFDVIIEDQTPFPMFSIFLGNFFHTPVVAVQHEFFDKSCYQVYDPITATIQLILQNMLRIFDYAAVIVPSSHVAGQFNQYGIPKENIHVITNGIDTEEYYQENIKTKSGHLIVVGRITKRKGQATVIKVVSELRKKGYDVHLHVVGDGPYKNTIESLVTELGLEPHVTIHGYVNNEKKIKLLNQSELFLFASRQEGLGNVLLEAMAAGCAIVARSLPVYLDFFDNGTNGILVKNADSNDIADKAAILLDDAKKIKKIRNNNLNTVRKFTWENYASTAENLLKKAQLD
jgi:glycosyltransferase involved in cell wall biosynthesis